MVAKIILFSFITCSFAETQDIFSVLSKKLIWEDVIENKEVKENILYLKNLKKNNVDASINVFGPIRGKMTEYESVLVKKNKFAYNRKRFWKRNIKGEKINPYLIEDMEIRKKFGADELLVRKSPEYNYSFREIMLYHDSLLYAKIRCQITGDECADLIEFDLLNYGHDFFEKKSFSKEVHFESSYQKILNKNFYFDWSRFFYEKSYVRLQYRENKIDLKFKKANYFEIYYKNEKIGFYYDNKKIKILSLPQHFFVLQKRKKELRNDMDIFFSGNNELYGFRQSFLYDKMGRLTTAVLYEENDEKLNRNETFSSSFSMDSLVIKYDFLNRPKKIELYNSGRQASVGDYEQKYLYFYSYH